MTTLKELLQRPEEPPEAYVVPLGPSHPLTHGTVRLILTLEGETILHCDPESGYLHRGFEKEVEVRPWNRLFPYVDRLNYVSALLNGFGFALAAEKLLGIEVPLRCAYVRSLLGEIARIGDHLTAIGTSAKDLAVITAFYYAIEGRELLWELLAQVTGARVTSNYARIGGLAADLPPAFASAWEAVKPRFIKVYRDIEELTSHNLIFRDRMSGTGVISAADAVAQGWTGPCLRSTGVDYDVRKDHPYFAYDRVDFEVPVGTRGDNLDRHLVRMEEILQSVFMVDQLLSDLPDGPVQVDDVRVVMPPKGEVFDTIEGMMTHFKLVSEGVALPEGEVYSYTEAANGELGFYLVSDGTGRPWRVHVRAPSFYHLGALPRLVEGGSLSDLVATFGTLNYVAGEADR